MKISVCVTNLGKYNEGELAFRWLDLPATEEEIENTMKAIGIGSCDCFGCPYEEFFFSEYESATLTG